MGEHLLNMATAIAVTSLGAIALGRYIGRQIARRNARAT